MSNGTPSIDTVSNIIQLGVDALQGRAPDGASVARTLMGLALDLVPEDELRQYLTDEARKRADAIAEAAEAAKFGR